jgi:hypothetical protein
MTDVSYNITARDKVERDGRQGRLKRKKEKNKILLGVSSHGPSGGVIPYDAHDRKKFQEKIILNGSKL